MRRNRLVQDVKPSDPDQECGNEDYEERGKGQFARQA